MGGASVELRTDKIEFWLHNYGFTDEYCWIQLVERDVEIFMPAGTSSRPFLVINFVEWGCY